MYCKFAMTLLLVIAATTASLCKGQEKIDPFKHYLEIISLKGKLLVCAVDLLNNQDKPEVRQFLHSIINYADSPDFSPYQELDPDILTEILKTD